MAARLLTGSMAVAAGRIAAAILLLALLAGCQRNAIELEPAIYYSPQSRCITDLPSAFPTLSVNERSTSWGQEMLIGRAFAEEMDLYRAITAYKRALVLMPSSEAARRQQVTYDILLCYYMGGKNQEVIEAFEASDLNLATPANFPPFGDLLLMLYDAYWQERRFERAEVMRLFIEQCSPETADDLSLTESIRQGRIADTRCLAAQRADEESVTSWLDGYALEAKSVRKAQWLNAVAPGAGYLYVGQKKTAVTSLVLNALFIAATYQFFDHGYSAAALITLSFEMGWYVGGINGAGLAAKEYNQRLYENYGKEILISNRLFPVLMFEYAF